MLFRGPIQGCADGGNPLTDAAIRQYLLRLAPKRGLLRSVGFSVLLVAGPVFGVLTFLGVHNGAWEVGAVGALVTLFACLFVYHRYRHTSISVTELCIEERGFWGRRNTFARSAAASVDLVHTFSPASPDPSPQLIVRDSDDRCLLRMRGAFWSIDAMREVAAYLEPVAAVHEEAMSATEFHERYPDAAYWIENRPIVRGALIAAATAVALALIFALSVFVGLPVTR